MEGKVFPIFFAHFRTFFQKLCVRSCGLSKVSNFWSGNSILDSKMHIPFSKCSTSELDTLNTDRLILEHFKTAWLLIGCLISTWLFTVCTVQCKYVLYSVHMAYHYSESSYSFPISFNTADKAHVVLNVKYPQMKWDWSPRILEPGPLDHHTTNKCTLIIIKVDLKCDRHKTLGYSASACGLESSIRACLFVSDDTRTG